LENILIDLNVTAIIYLESSCRYKQTDGQLKSGWRSRSHGSTGL